MGKIPESVIRMIPNAMEYIPNSREDKGRKIRPRSEKYEDKMGKKAK